MSAARRGSAAIVGVAESDLGQVGPHVSPVDLMAQATRRALDDAGLRLADVDGVFTATTQLPFPTLSLCEYLGLSPRYLDGTNLGGASFLSHLGHAVAALASGLCRVALIAYGSTQRSVGRRHSARQEVLPYEEPYRPRFPVTAYALAASRHMHLYGTTREQMAEVAVAARRWAQLNPQAWSREPLTVEEVLAAPMVSTPFGVRDCCLVTDGGCAVVLTRAERAAAGRRKPVYVLGTGEVTTHRHIASMPDITSTAARRSGAQAFGMAGLAAADVDVAQIYDAFSILPIMFLEDLGFCPKGEGGPFVASGRIAPGGDLPLNTNGGGLSYCHPGMYGLFLVVEAVRQLRGECGARQVADCEVALAHANGGLFSAECTVLLGTASTV